MIVVMAEYFILVILVCIFYLCYTAFEAKKNQSLYNENKPNSIVSKNNFSTETTENKFKELYLAAKQENQEVIGWLSIDNTDISYPLLQTMDNSYYLTHNHKNENCGNGDYAVGFARPRRRIRRKRVCRLRKTCHGKHSRG